MPKTPSDVCLNLVSQMLLVVMLLKEDATCSVVFQPSSLVVSGPSASAFLVGNVSDISLTISNVSPSNTTGGLPPPSCAPSSSVQWTLSQELMGRSGLLVRVSLNRSLQLCGNETECCARPLCVRETLRVSACQGNTLLTSLTVQAEIYALLPSAGHVSGNKTVIPNQVFQPLGRCPCDLLPGECDIRCCCDQDCTPELLSLFAGQCLPGPFGGHVTPAPDYSCSAQSAENAPDWFPFLCVTSPSENNPLLGLFYQGKTVTPKPAPSFQTKQVTPPAPPTSYRQGDPIFRMDDQYFTIPQMAVLGRCLEKAPVAFLQDFEAACVSVLQECPGPAAELGVAVRDGLGGVVTVSVVDEVITDPSSFLSNPAKVDSGPAQASGKQLCVSVVLALSYTMYWKSNGLSAISVTRRIGNVTFNPGVSLTNRYSALFVNGNVTAQHNSGNPGYQVGRPVIGGFLDSTTGAIRRAPISLWQAVGNGQCSTADLRPVLYGLNSTSGCLVSVSLLNLTQCSQFRETVWTALAALVPATLVSRTGKPDFSTLANWTRVTTVVQNSSQPAGVSSGVCSGVPTHLHIHIRSAIMGTVEGVPQNMIEAVELSFKETTWSVECDTSGSNPCVTPDLMQSFSITSSVTFTVAPISLEVPKTRFRINFTEFDCERNDVCWPELVFPLTTYYKGEPHSQALAKGLILVFFFIAASVLGTPWRQIRQAWGSIQL
ncbi:tectonic-2 isoform X2 [Electrophorus electricus]|uniref:tectonic-2 isoform X2 n=1 Tax=Electrophorus electricus TaxID=8005 RepID=UPI0015D0A041|nr:tectonic-2 isoform X2 [Electrophorus electricus]